ncbi:MAG TPA: hypothetical protein VET65_13205 [Candidatus Limnocylindrales bacterium]|nr:hypothetical protein [Candidatus Limnocylindrales bacterium]
MTPAIGYRLWYADLHDGLTRWRLQSLLAETLWPFRDRLEAVCERRLAARAHWRLRQLGVPRHLAPATECSCGAHAYHDLEAMMLQVQRLGHFRPLGDRRILVGGAILSWGRIVIHPEGFRAQYARPLALCLVDPTAPTTAAAQVAEVAQAYAVPALELKYLAAHAREFGTSYRPAPTPSSLQRLSRAALGSLRQLWSGHPGSGGG